MMRAARSFQPRIRVRSGASGPRKECTIADSSMGNAWLASLIFESSSARMTSLSSGAMIVSIGGLSVVVPLAWSSPTGQHLR